MFSLVFATNNLHKLREIREITGNTINVRSLTDIGLDADIPETQDTIEGNARQKARFIYEKTGMDCFADDTGLEIAALNGEPGVYSARYAGEGCSFADNVRKVLEEMLGMDDRRACFRCAICLIYKGNEFVFEGRIDGEITFSQSGSDGFGYDPVFRPEGQPQTFAEMPPYLKNGLSHRGRAVHQMLQYLNQFQ
ncbi:MAG: RdgB/HAM1 family non-canonical purine NTP pyrophosphatase [Bacteroidetes bacterium]|nr:RdgB/HAM1 family non-canonical purine NTP pyrophosphatase [Bacteroidota bacterium]